MITCENAGFIRDQRDIARTLDLVRMFSLPWTREISGRGWPRAKMGISFIGHGPGVVIDLVALGQWWDCLKVNPRNTVTDPTHYRSNIASWWLRSEQSFYTHLPDLDLQQIPSYWEHLQQNIIQSLVSWTMHHGKINRTDISLYTSFNWSLKLLFGRSAIILIYKKF